MATVRKVKTGSKVRTPVSGTPSGDELQPIGPRTFPGGGSQPDPFDELEELQTPGGGSSPAGSNGLLELDDLDELQPMDDGPAPALLPKAPARVSAEEPPVSQRDMERMAREAFEQSKHEVELQELEARHSGKKRKVRDPRKEFYANLSVILITLIIAGGFFYIAYEDYRGDAASSHDPNTYDMIKDENLWYFSHNNTVSHDNMTGSRTGSEAAREYKDFYRMDGPYARDQPFGPFTIELNWVYFLVMGILVITGPNGIVRRNAINRLKAKEGKFPDFIRDLAEFWKGGLSMRVAVETLSKGDYGALDEEVEFMATQLSWGVAFNEVLEMFLERVHTGLIERSVALIGEANKAGGKISDILLNVAHDAQEIKMLDRQREGTMKSYIFVTFVSFLIYVIIIVIMAYVFLPAIAESTEDLNIEGGLGNVKIQSFEPTFIALIFFASVIVQSIGGGVNAGIMGEGNIGASLWYITLFTLIGAIIFQLAGVQLGLG